nr:SDR family NAD(P)-dependent oxidoreductase [Geosporobacter ferrireducens]
MNTKQNVVLITGGSSGIGLALAKKFSSEENKVIIVSRSEQKLASVKAQFPQIITEAADITEEYSIAKLVAKYKDVNILVNNAGVHHECSFRNGIEDFSLLRNEIDTNFVAPVMLAEKFIPELFAKKKTRLLSIFHPTLASVPNRVFLCILQLRLQCVPFQNHSECSLEVHPLRCSILCLPLSKPP